MLLKNFGHFWERKYINYGYGKTPGHLIGYRTKNHEVDFREQIGIYALYDKDFVPIYVGQAGNGKAGLLSRLNSHETDHLWNRWIYFSWFGFKRVNPKSPKLSKHDKVDKKFTSDGSRLLDEFEAITIQVLDPKLNKQGPKWKITGVKQYIQRIDDELEDVTNFELLDEIRKVKNLLDKRDKKAKSKKANRSKTKKRKIKKRKKLRIRGKKKR